MSKRRLVPRFFVSAHGVNYPTILRSPVNLRGMCGELHMEAARKKSENIFIFPIDLRYEIWYNTGIFLRDSRQARRKPPERSQRRLWLC